MRRDNDETSAIAKAAYELATQIDKLAQSRCQTDNTDIDLIHFLVSERLKVLSTIRNIEIRTGNRQF